MDNEVCDTQVEGNNAAEDIIINDNSTVKLDDIEDRLCGGNIELEKEEERVCDDTPSFRPEKFTFHIKYKKWKKIDIKTNRRGDRSLTGNWTSVLAKAISKENPACPLIFRCNHVRKLNSRKKNCPFFTAKASCKFQGCIRYTVNIRKEPKEGKPVKVKVKAIKPFTQISHEHGVVKGRPIKGIERKHIADAIQQSGPSNVYYEKLGNVDSTAYKAGNSTGYGTKEVMQKISSESSLSMRLHKDVIAEVALLKKVYEKEDDTVGVLKGSIQSLSMFPFAVSLYNSQQISLLAEHIRTGTATLYFDATGKVISNIPSQPKKVLYYPLILKGQEKGDPPVPVAEFISNSHNTVDISAFFLKLSRDLHQSYPSTRIPQRIEIDFSWAFIHAILLAFNHEDINSYLQRAWDSVHMTCDWGINTKVHICSAHLLHKISGRLSQLVKIKDCRKYILYVIARMVDAENLEQIDTCFRSLCTLLLSKNFDSHPHVERSIKYLDKVVADEGPDTGVDVFEDNTDDEAEDKATSTQPSTSAFAIHFRRISDEVKSETKNGISGENPYYSPDAVMYLLNTYMKILPLWTGLMLDGDRHDTNSPAENWMKIVKKDILGCKTRLTPSNFIIEVRANLKGRLREFSHRQHIQKQTVDHLESEKKKKESKESTSFIVSEEKWGGKKAKKGIYFSSPVKILKIKKPKKTGLCEQKKKGDNRGREKGLHWGGKVQFGDRVLHLSNTCPVDNLLMVIYYVLQQNHIKNWFEGNKANLEVCQVLLDVSSLFQSGNWREGRALWLRKFLPVPTTDTWNIWGSEAEKFVCHFGEVQETEVSSSCSKRTCPRKQRILKSREILLGDKDNSGSCCLHESLKQWEETFPSMCSYGTPYGQCKGVRTSTQRKFVQKCPPVLIMSVSYLSQARGLVPSALPDTVVVQANRYDLFAYTVGTGDHFKAYLQINNSWHKYDGLDSPEVSELGSRGEDGQLEHAVYILKY